MLGAARTSRPAHRRRLRRRSAVKAGGIFSNIRYAQTRVSLDRAIRQADGAVIPLAPRGADELRLIRFEERWLIVYVDLFARPIFQPL